MDRLDQDQAVTAGLPAGLDSAADNLRSTIERQVQGIVETAEKRAAAIEEDARAKAREIVRESERMSQEILQGAFDRASRMLESIELAETGFGSMMEELRAETKKLLEELEPSRILDVAATQRQPPGGGSVSGEAAEY